MPLSKMTEMWPCPHPLALASLCEVEYAMQTPANGAKQVMIQAQASFRTMSSLMHSASGTAFLY